MSQSISPGAQPCNTCRLHIYVGPCFCNGKSGEVFVLYSRVIPCGIGANDPLREDKIHHKICKYCHGEKSRAREGDERRRKDIEREEGDRETLEMMRRIKQANKERQRELREEKETEMEKERKREEERERERKREREATDRQLRENIERERKRARSVITRSGGNERSKRGERGERINRREQVKKENASRGVKVGRGGQGGEKIDRNEGAQRNARDVRSERREKQVRWEDRDREEREAVNTALQAEIASIDRGIDYW
ncbi:hypothetical protein BTUL_0110g00440 [Botrytis tulipae]|uniref:Uncharacterized protein n=1 Tax=Botrytis tulipae TaxID=87230 RepID=A0A4Z1EM65_9HELO|nr:hypothetical protein BTUL_0110g00440 [Botrytis tulipae]